MNPRHILMAIALGLTTPALGRASEEVAFNDDIRPILSEYCFACHGRDAEARKADLRLDTFEGATADGAIVPGDAGASEVIARIRHDDPEERMPPPESKKSLDPRQKEMLARWIDAGAKWQEHWAFIKPERPEVPQPRGVASWAKNPIDHFVLAKMQEPGLELAPNAEADRETLARRAALDLTGLPPDQERVDAFVADQSADAYEKFVDTLLASPRAAEHRARYWLDAARYGDTHGMHLDNYREMWPYRDWVIEAFRANMPYDQFVTEQIAGDLLPGATQAQRIATGFNRCNVTTAEGGAIPAELEVLYMVDRVKTTATVFMGLTAGCAVCHDHKYDPITKREFYQLGAFFNNTTQPAMDGNQKDTPPVVVLPKPEFEEEWGRLQSRRARLRGKMKRAGANAETWWAARTSAGEHPVAPDKLVAWLPLTEGEGEPAIDLPQGARWEENHPAGKRGMRFGDKVALETKLEPLRSDEPLTLSFWVRTPDNVINSTLFDQTTTVTVDEKKKTKKTVGWKVTSSVQGALTFELFDATGKSTKGLLPGDEALTPRSWQHVCVRYSGGQSTASISILVDGKERVQRNADQEYVEATALAEVPLKIATKFPTGGFSDIRIFKRWVSGEEVTLLAAEHRLAGLLSSDAPWNELKKEERGLLTLFHDNTISKDYRALSRTLASTQLRRDYIYARSDTTLVMEERRNSEPRAWDLERGEYDKRLEEVAPGVPAVLPPLPGGTPANRLALARWLVDPGHPLTARVAVNSFWQSFFGTGLVKTSEDFGTMGDPPSHPELLEWLSVEFVESGWDVRRILKLIATSATYRQSGVTPAEKLKKDPNNRFLARGPRVRLDAEVVRDQALAVSGLLRPDIGGPSVKPYQPAGLWKVVAQAGSNTKEFKQDSGDALYRRSLYTYWKRTTPPPSMAAFDAPTREQCTVRRERTNTPLQALVLMNDPQFVEAARHLAENALHQSGNDRQRASWMLQEVFARRASAADLDDMVDAIAEFRRLFKPDPEGARSLVETGDSEIGLAHDAVELAAWTMIANTLMNRDDFVNKN